MGTLYKWRHLQFAAPEGRDESTVLIVDDRDLPRWNLTVQLDEIGETPTALADYLAQQELPSGVHEDARQDTTVAAREAVLLTRHLAAKGQAPLLQYQACVENGRQVIIITMTTQPSARSQAKRAFDALLASLSLEET